MTGSRLNSMHAAILGALPQHKEGAFTMEEFLSIERAREEGKVEGALRWVRDSGLQDRDETLSLLLAVGRDSSAHVFVALFEEGLLPEGADALVGDVWSMAEFPCRMLELWQWEEMFQWSGYRHDGRPAERPADALTLYRGAPARHRGGLAWTASREMAEWFATRNRDQFGWDAKVWTAAVEPWRLLAHIDDRREEEYVVDTVDLDIRPA